MNLQELCQCTYGKNKFSAPLGRGRMRFGKGGVMQKNIHRYERVLRTVGGLALSSLAFWGPRKSLFLSFLIPVATGMIGKCPLYSALGINTRQEDRKGEISDNEYFETKSDSEIAAGHPIVGVS
jgi:hypothetical protein